MKKLVSSSLTIILLIASVAMIFTAFNFVGTANAADQPTIGTGTPQTWDSHPNKHFTDVGFTVTNPTLSYDSDLNTKANFTYSSGTGTQKALELYNFTSPAVAPWTSSAYSPLPTISRVDFKMKYNVSENTGAKDDQYRIVYRVSPSTTAQVLTDWRNDYTANILYVNGFDNSFTGWTRVGSSPYLSAIDYPSNYISAIANYSETIGVFDFADLGTYGGGKIYLEFYCNTNSTGADEIATFLWNGTNFGAIGSVYPAPTWGWQSIDITTKINSTSMVNGAKVYFVPVGATEMSNSLLKVDAMRLRILNAGWQDVPSTAIWTNRPEPNDGVWSWTDINNIRFAVETSRVSTQDAGCKFFEFESWVTVYSPPAQLKMSKTSIDTSATPPTSVTLRPNGDSTLIQWTPSSGTTHYTLVDEAVLDTSDYVYTTLGNRRECYSFEDPVGPPGWTIGAVRVTAYARYTAAADERLYGLIKNPASTTTYTSSNYYTLTTSFAKYSWDFAKNPVPDPDIDWTWADIANLQAGVTALMGGATFTRTEVAQVYVEVLGPRLPVSLYTEGAMNIWGYSLIMRYNTTVLTAVGSSGISPFTTAQPSLINDAQGFNSFGYTMAFGTALGAFGNVSLGTAYFIPDATGTSNLDLYNTQMTSPAGVSLSHNVNDIDVDVISVSASGSGSWTLAYKGYTRPITVTIKNKAYHTYNVTVVSYLNSSANIAHNVLNLAPGASTTFTITLAFSNLAYGDYKIWALAELAPNDVKGLGDGTIRLTIPGDVNGDKIVDVFDILNLKSHRSGPPPGPGGYSRDADINDDNVVDVFDLLIAKAHLGQSW